MNSSEAMQEAIILTITGEITGERVSVLEKEFLEKLSNLKSGDNVHLDLQSVNRIDSRGISLCVGLFKECVKHNAGFLIKASPESYRILTHIKLNKLFEIKEISI